MVLLNVSNLPWVQGRLKRNQAIFSSLLGGNNLVSSGVFVNPPTIASGVGRKYFALPSLQDVKHLDSTHIVEPIYALPHWHVKAMRRRWAATVFHAIRRHLGDERYILWMNSAGRLQTELAECLAPNAVLRVFDASDDFTAWEGPEYPAQLRRVIALCDVVICVNEHVCSIIDHPNKIVFRNCTDFDAFRQTNPGFRLNPWYPKPPGAKYIGFTGGINETRADESLLRALFERFSQYQFLFVGYTDSPSFVQRLTRYRNVAFVPEIPYQQLPDLIGGFDVAIIPHSDNAVTRGNDLLKVLDYFACGVPVVSTRCSNVDSYQEALRIADSTQEFGDWIEEIVSGHTVHDPTPGYAIARERDWTTQVPRLATQILDPVLSKTSSRDPLPV